MTDASRRIEVLQAIADRLPATSYLEIGVQSGDTFFPLRIRKKLAVDPRFLFGWRSKLNWVRWNRHNLFNEYYPMPSDLFFAHRAAKSNRRKLDLVFVDGLHTYAQSLRDVENSLVHLSENGIVVIDDCNPRSAAAADPVKADSQKIWNGDVWKTIVHIRSTRPDLTLWTLDYVYGLGILVKTPATIMLDYSTARIEMMTYEDLDQQREQLLDLKPFRYLDEFLGSLLRPGRVQDR